VCCAPRRLIAVCAAVGRAETSLSGAPCCPQGPAFLLTITGVGVQCRLSRQPGSTAGVAMLPAFAVGVASSCALPVTRSHRNNWGGFTAIRSQLKLVAPDSLAPHDRGWAAVERVGFCAVPRPPSPPPSSLHSPPLPHAKPPTHPAAAVSRPRLHNAQHEHGASCACFSALPMSPAPPPL
jgi:hypothetical protein